MKKLNSANKGEKMKSNKEKRAEYNKKYREENKEKQREYNKEWYQNNKEKQKEAQREYRKDNPIKVKEAHKKWRACNVEERRAKARLYYKENKHKYRDSYLRSTYGITLVQYNEMLERQDNRCAICKTDDPIMGHVKHFCVDHDHVTGKVRGILCLNCNLGIGNLQDSSENLRNAADYLDKQDKVLK